MGEESGTSTDSVWGSPWAGWGELDVGRDTRSLWATRWMLEKDEKSKWTAGYANIRKSEEKGKGGRK